MGYKDIFIELNQFNVLPENNILESILSAIFKSTKTDKANAKYRTNMQTYMYQMNQPVYLNENSEIGFDVSRVVDLDGTDITEKEIMSNPILKLNEQKYLSYTHGFSPINEYNNPHLITCMFPTLLP
jgi:hypothetical protein